MSGVRHDGTQVRDGMVIFMSQFMFLCVAFILTLTVPTWWQKRPLAAKAHPA